MLPDLNVPKLPKLQSWIIIALLAIIVLLLNRSCNQQQSYNNLLQQVSKYKLENKEYKTQRLKDSSTIAIQEQTILTTKEALATGLLQIQKELRSVQAQLSARIDVAMKAKDIPFIPKGYADTTGSGIIRDTSGKIVKTDSISVPQPFRLEEKYFLIRGTVEKTRLQIDTLFIPNKITATFGMQKTGFLKLGSKPVVTLKSENPYVDVSGFNNVVIKEKKKFYQKKGFWFGFGAVVAETVRILLR